MTKLALTERTSNRAGGRLATPALNPFCLILRLSLYNTGLLPEGPNASTTEPLVTRLAF